MIFILTDSVSISKCSFDITASDQQQLFITPVYTSKYQEECEWTLYAVDGYQVELILTEGNLSECEELTVRIIRKKLFV